MTEDITTSLRAHLDRRGAGERFTVTELRRVASDCASQLAALHARGVVHGSPTPVNITLTTRPDGSIGGASLAEPARADGTLGCEDDVQLLALTLLEMWTPHVPGAASPGVAALRLQAPPTVVAAIHADELRQLFRCLSVDPKRRPRARDLLFCGPGATPVRRDVLDPGLAPDPAAARAFDARAQGLLATYSTWAKEYVGELAPLESTTVTIGRQRRSDVRVPENTVSAGHAVLRWRNDGTWVVDDLGSTNGTFGDEALERRASLILAHGGEVQMGELRFKLVSFGLNSEGHRRARAFLASHDGLTGLLGREPFLEALDEDAAFAEWARVPLTVARYELRSRGGRPVERWGIHEMLSLRMAARRVVALTDALLVSLVSATAGLTGEGRFCTVMLGPGPDEARALVQAVVATAESSLPAELELAATARGVDEGDVRHLA